MERSEVPPGAYTEQAQPNESRALLIKRIQDSAVAAGNRLRLSTATNTTWAIPSQVFPQAILAMASCLVSGSDEQLRTIQLDIPIEGLKTPRPSLNCLLEHSSILGRDAFNQAEVSMGNLGSTASLAQRQVDNIMYYIGRGPPASVALAEELNAFQSLAARLPDVIAELDTPFEKWSGLTDKLREHLSEHLGSGPIDWQLDQQLARAEREFQEACQELSHAESHYHEQQASMAKCIAREIPKEMSLDELMKEITKLLRQESSKWPGISKLIRSIWEGSKSDDDVFDARVEKHMTNLSKAMEVSASDSRGQRDSLQQKIQATKECVETAGSALQEARQKRRRASDHLDTLRVSTERARQNLELLAEHSIDLKTIEQILWDSTRDLRRLRSYIGSLSIFFKELSNIVETTVSEYFDSLNRGIQMGQAICGGEVAGYNTLDKHRLLDNIYDINGRLCAISNISHVYKFISATYIRPGLDRMEDLDRTDKVKFKSEIRELDSWCHTAVRKIECETQERSQRVFADMDSRIKFITSAALAQSQFWAS